MSSEDLCYTLSGLEIEKKQQVVLHDFMGALESVDALISFLSCCNSSNTCWNSPLLLRQPHA